MAIGASGINFNSPGETWEPTKQLAFIEIDGKKILHQWWVSSACRTEWKPVPEISSYFANTGNA